MGAEIDQRMLGHKKGPGKSSTECGGTRGYPSESNEHWSVVQCAEHLSRASRHFSLHDRDYLQLQRCLERKLRALMLGTASWEGQVHTRTSVGKVAIGALCLRIVRAETQMVPEHRQRTSKARTSPMLLVGTIAFRNVKYAHRWSTFASRGKRICETTADGTCRHWHLFPSGQNRQQTWRRTWEMCSDRVVYWVGFETVPGRFFHAEGGPL